MKRLMSCLAVGMCSALLGGALTVSAGGLSTPETGLLNVTEKLDVGGTILEPGEYQIKVVPSRLDRNLLQVTSTDGRKLFATLLSVPHTEGPAGQQIPESRFVYYPAVTGQIMALRTWYASNTPASGGHDIVYPKLRAMELAARAKAPVVAVADEVKVVEFETAPLVVVTPEKEVKPYTSVVAQKEPVPETPPAREVKVAETRPLREELPQTASNLPLVAGLGILSLLGALGLAVLARRVA